MRTARIRYQGAGAFYHCMNRCAGYATDRPWEPKEQEYFVKLLHRLSKFYTVEVISYCVMSNHYHVVLRDPGDLPTVEETVRRYNSYYKGKRQIDGTVGDIEQIRARLSDFSRLLKDLQQLFTGWYNRSRPKPRRGRLWGDRFKSVLLDGESALWSCIKYVELNPVRAGITDDPADYRFSSWGAWSGSGKHPFGREFFNHVKRSLGNRAKGWAIAEVAAELRADMAKTIEAERNDATSESVKTAYAEAKRRPSLQLVATRRMRYWTDGAVIGSKLFVQKVAIDLYGEEKAKRRRYGRGELPEGGGAV